MSLQPELIFGRIQAGIHFGLYLYNPLRNLEPVEIDPVTKQMIEPHFDKPLIYAYNIEEEDGSFIPGHLFKYAITKHWFLSLGLKTHMQKAEFIEWNRIQTLICVKITPTENSMAAGNTYRLVVTMIVCRIYVFDAI